MSMKKFLTIFAAALAIILSGCKQSATDYLDQLSNEIKACTTETEYDKVYEKIIALQNDDRFKSNPQNAMEILAKTTRLTNEALAVKAILYVMPKSVTPTKEDIKSLTDICIKNKLNVTVLPYSEVRDLVYKHFKTAN